MMTSKVRVLIAMLLLVALAATQAMAQAGTTPDYWGYITGKLRDLGMQFIKIPRSTHLE